MEEREIDDRGRLQDRVTRLERQNRGLWWAFVGLASLAFGVLTGSDLVAAKRPVVEASRFVLEDEQGSKRGELAVDSDGSGRFVLYGPDGLITAELPFRQQSFPIRR